MHRFESDSHRSTVRDTPEDRNVTEFISERRHTSFAVFSLATICNNTSSPGWGEYITLAIVYAASKR